MGVLAAWLASGARQNPAQEDLLVADCEAGRPGGRLIVSLRAEPKTFNPVTALEIPSREIAGRMMADLIPIDRETQLPVAGLAKSWSVSPDGREYTLELRRGIRFSDGHPFDASDVLFTFQVYLDEKIHSSQRDLLLVGGRPIAVERLDAYTVRFRLAQPRAAAERIFDSIAILPRHLLEEAYRQGRFAQAWQLSARPQEIAGLGPYKLKQYVPGERVVLERNPYYWKIDRRGQRLPYFNELVFTFVAEENTQVMQLLAGETDLLGRIGARNFAALEKERRPDLRLLDLGPGMDYTFLFFNLNEPEGKPTAAQTWFRNVAFRRAVSSAIDREAIVRLVYDRRATPLWTHISPGNKLWFDPAIPRPPRSPGRARDMLTGAGFAWNQAGELQDGLGRRVEFSLLTTAGNPERTQIATMIQADLKELGIAVQTVPLEFRSQVDRVLNTHQYEACVLGLGGADGDPNSELGIWLSSGATHLWHPNQARPATAWEAEIDRLMRQQLTTLKYAERKRLYSRVQELESEQLPIVCLVSPHVLVAGRASLGNFRPAILEPYALWNVEELYDRGRQALSR